ncbi:DgyrCDS13974 [Dimorphilus gyrociliatus]|uniref:DgyrCDS13974 n=1 Tax=Dimorphilus gyrociliatus TaxID=2664684 RepID=A0A7I8WCH0_9ANNE|nr:DgyrCDS13974 [Dimorphilus gyrociliatus]
MQRDLKNDLERSILNTIGKVLSTNSSSSAKNLCIKGNFCVSDEKSQMLAWVQLDQTFKLNNNNNDNNSNNNNYIKDNEEDETEDDIISQTPTEDEADDGSDFQKEWNEESSGDKIRTTTSSMTFKTSLLQSKNCQPLKRAIDVSMFDSPSMVSPPYEYANYDEDALPMDLTIEQKVKVDEERSKKRTKKPSENNSAEISAKFADKLQTVSEIRDGKIRIRPVMSGNGRYMCPWKGCDVSYKHYGTMKHHVQQTHCGLRHTCNYCGQDFQTIQGMSLHKKTKHWNMMKFTCSNCSERFNTQTAMAQHYNKVHEKKIQPSI